MNPSKLEAELATSWQVKAGAWTDAIRGGKIPSRRIGTDAAIVDVVTDLHPRRALDVGCGEGWLTRALVERGIETLGVDGSAALILSACTAGGGVFACLSFDAIVSAPAQLPGPYDVAICNFSLLGQDLFSLLGALASTLTPRGHLVVQTTHPWFACGDSPYVDGWREEHFASFGNEMWKPMPWYFRTLQSWQSTLAGAGLLTTQSIEPLDPLSQRPLSLILVARPAP